MASKIERVSTEREPPGSALVSTTASVGEKRDRRLGISPAATAGLYLECTYIWLFVRLCRFWSIDCL